MNKTDIFNKMEKAFDEVLDKLFEEHDIKTGDISPLQVLRLEELLTELTELSIDLMNQNK